MPRPKQLPLEIDGLWLLLLAAYILAGAALVPFHGDEATQLFMGRDFYYLFRDGDLSKVRYDSAWTSRPDEQHLRLINGTLSKTIYGGLAAGAGMSRDDINGQWDWQLDFAANRDLGNLPAAELLRRARLASAAQLALAAALLYALVRMTIGRPEAYVASALFALHPAILLNSRRAMMEGSHLLGLMLVLLAGAWLMRERTWWRYFILGLCAGLAIAAKHPNAFVLATLFLACWLWFLREARLGRGKPVRFMSREPNGGLIFASAIALLVFYLLNPAWWFAPIASGLEVLSSRVDLLNEQIRRFGGYSSLLEQAQGLYRYVFVEHRQYFEAPQWSELSEISRQISAYEASALSGYSLGEIGGGLVGGIGGGLLGLALTVYGALKLMRRRSVKRANRWLLLACGGGVTLISLAATPLPWQRYYLPVLPFICIFSACALVSLATLFWDLIFWDLILSAYRRFREPRSKKARHVHKTGKSKASSMLASMLATMVASGASGVSEESSQAR